MQQSNVTFSLASRAKAFRKTAFLNLLFSRCLGTIIPSLSATGNSGNGRLQNMNIQHMNPETLEESLQYQYKKTQVAYILLKQMLVTLDSII